MGSILAMDHYQEVFNTGMDGPKVSLVTSLYTVYDPSNLEEEDFQPFGN